MIYNAQRHLISMLQRVHLDKLYASLQLISSREKLPEKFLFVDKISLLPERKNEYEELIKQGKTRFEEYTKIFDSIGQIKSFTQKGDPILFTEYILSKTKKIGSDGQRIIFSVLLSRHPLTYNKNYR